MQRSPAIPRPRSAPIPRGSGSPGARQPPLRECQRHGPQSHRQQANPGQRLRAFLTSGGPQGSGSPRDGLKPIEPRGGCRNCTSTQGGSSKRAENGQKLRKQSLFYNFMTVASRNRLGDPTDDRLTPSRGAGHLWRPIVTFLIRQQLIRHRRGLVMRTFKASAKTGRDFV